MGNCSSYEKPDYTNQCDVSLNEEYEIPGFCSEWLISVPEQKAACHSIGGDDIPEFVRKRYGDHCFFDSMHPNRNVTKLGCCPELFSCALPGGFKNVCERTSYQGDPFECCLKDYDCTLIPDNCWSDKDKNLTCANDSGPGGSTRRGNSPRCKQAIMDTCVNDAKDIGELASLWSSKNSRCMTALKRVIGRPTYDPNIPNPASTDQCKEIQNSIFARCGESQDSSKISVTGFEWALELVQKMVDKYTLFEYEFGAPPNSPKYHPFQGWFHQNICCGTMSALCDIVFAKTCLKYSRDDVAAAPSIADFCGCLLDPSQYDDYAETYNVGPECTPWCNRSNSIPKIDSALNPVLCKQTTCIINNDVVSLMGSTVGKGVNFNQVCHSCANGADCTCTIDSNSIEILNSKVSAGINTEQQCGKSYCSVPNKNPKGPKTMYVPCGDHDDSFNVAAQNHQKEVKSFRLSIIITIMLCFGVIVIILCLFIFLSPKKALKQNSLPTISQEQFDIGADDQLLDIFHNN